MSDRGVIYNTGRKQQIVSFKNLVYGTITPTDIDMVIEYHNKGYVICEVKYRETPVPNGQKLALERMVIDFGKTKQAIAIVVEHDVENVNEQIDAAQCIVREVFISGKGESKWRPLNRRVNLKQAIDLFIKWVEQTHE